MTDILDPKHPKWGEYLEPPSAPAQEPHWVCAKCGGKRSTGWHYQRQDGSITGGIEK